MIRGAHRVIRFDKCSITISIPDSDYQILFLYKLKIQFRINLHCININLQIFKGFLKNAI